MAKRGRKPTTNEYKKVLERATSELQDKKKSLIRAEKTLANAKKAHDELVAEVARLDMVERSLKAFVEGTEPPQNIKYVYNYPQWVWQPTTWTVPYYSPNYTYCNSVGLADSGNVVTSAIPSVTTFTNAGYQGQNSVFNATTVGNCGLNDTPNFCLNTSTFNAVNTGQTTTTSDSSCITVDLSTNEAMEPAEATLSVSNS